jgi:hypothetical protein
MISLLVNSLTIQKGLIELVVKIEMYTGDNTHKARQTAIVKSSIFPIQV